jgi:SNF2 family DNA or RNA helicase
LVSGKSLMVEIVKEVRKLKAGRYKIPVTLTYKGGRIYLAFAYSKPMIKTVKTMEGHKWHGFDEPTPRKIWSVKDSPRNAFRLDYLSGLNPYERYDKPLIEFEPTRPLYAHQIIMVQHILTRKRCVLAGEMGLGKSLAFIEALEHIPAISDPLIWYIGPKSGVVSVKRELVKWKCKYHPRMFTYEKFVKELKEWVEGTPPPRVICYDESSKLKNPNAQRSQSAKYLAEQAIEFWGNDCYLIEMSGTPAPKAPTDWWHQAEVVCPGFLLEGALNKFKQRLSLIEMRQSLAGGVYPHLVSWLDNEEKCSKCGAYPNAVQHEPGEEFDHRHIRSKNEVAHLYERIKDLALIQFKRDCVDLPEKQYQILKVKPSVATLRAARLIRKTSRRAVTALTLLRELSDGFQYTEEVIGKEECPQCKGTGKVMRQVPREEVDPMAPLDVRPEDFEKKEICCEVCDEDCMVDVKKRIAQEIDTPKDAAFIQLLDDHEDGGRFVVWGGFTGTIDRLIRIAHEQGWATLRVDGRGYHGCGAMGEVIDSDDLLDAMDASNPRRQELLDKHPKVCMVGHPRAGGMGLTFNISPIALYYSNDFDGEARMQSEDRIHRIGMPVNRCALIVDLIHLPTDTLVLNNLKKKKKLQNLTMGELDDAFTDDE